MIFLTTQKTGIYRINGQSIVLMQFQRNKFTFEKRNGKTKCINGRFQLVAQTTFSDYGIYDMYQGNIS